MFRIFTSTKERLSNRLTHFVNLRIDAKTLNAVTTTKQLEQRIETLELELKEMRVSLGQVVTGLSDQQRANGELLEQLVRRVQLLDQPQVSQS